MSNKHPLENEEELSPDDSNYDQVYIDSDVENELLADDDISDNVNISVDLQTSS